MRLTLKKRSFAAFEQFDTSLYDQTTFYKTFLRDIRTCQEQLIIESAFITTRRVAMLLPIFKQLRERGVQMIINTRNPKEHDDTYQLQAAQAVAAFHELDIVVLYTAGHHRKLAVIDNEIVWEGSLNILSFSDSCEIMRRTTSTAAAQQLLSFTGILKHLK